MGERCYVCGGVGRRSSFVLAAGDEIEGECPDCEGTGILPPPIGYGTGGVVDPEAARRMSDSIDANGANR